MPRTVESLFESLGKDRLLLEMELGMEAYNRDCRRCHSLKARKTLCLK